MEKITPVFIIVVLFLINITSASEIPLESVLIPKDLNQIDENYKFIRDRYDIRIKFFISDSEDSANQEAFNTFKSEGLNFGNMKSYNVLVFYNIKKNQLKFVSKRYCSLGNNNLQIIKNKKFIWDVLNKRNPSNTEISNMFTKIFEEFLILVEQINPSPDVCKFSYYEEKLALRNNEYIVPAEVLKAMYVIVMRTSWGDDSPGGLYVSRNFMKSNFIDFLPWITSKKERFINLLKEKTDFSDEKIQFYYGLLTTRGNVIVEDNYGESILFHERIHKIITEDLTYDEKKELMRSRKKILGSEHFLDYLDKEYIPYFLQMTIKHDNWQEFYVYMAQFEKYPQSQSQSQYIDEEIYDLFFLQYSEAHRIYKKVLELSSN